MRERHEVNGGCVALVGVDGAHGVRSDTPISPSRWCGEVACVVGPFSSESIASRFAGGQTDFGSYQAYGFRVFAKRDSWYVEVREAENEPLVIEI